MWNKLFCSVILFHTAFFHKTKKKKRMNQKKSIEENLFDYLRNPLYGKKNQKTGEMETPMPPPLCCGKKTQRRRQKKKNETPRLFRFRQCLCAVPQVAAIMLPLSLSYRSVLC